VGRGQVGVFSCSSSLACKGQRSRQGGQHSNSADKSQWYRTTVTYTFCCSSTMDATA
jgi:hypothetical protein